eukprot:393698-Rhodomonas_salina.9
MKGMLPASACANTAARRRALHACVRNVGARAGPQTWPCASSDLSPCAQRTPVPAGTTMRWVSTGEELAGVLVDRGLNLGSPYRTHGRPPLLHPTHRLPPPPSPFPHTHQISKTKRKKGKKLEPRNRSTLDTSPRSTRSGQHPYLRCDAPGVPSRRTAASSLGACAGRSTRAPTPASALLRPARARTRSSARSVSYTHLTLPTICSV